MKTNRWSALAILLLAFCIASCDLEGLEGMSKVTEEFNANFPLNPGGAIEVYSKNGSVEILGWEKDTVEVRATKQARDQAGLDSIRIDVAAKPESIVVRSVFQDNRVSGKGVRYTIRAPLSARIATVDTSNGHVRVEEVSHAASLKTSNGSITVNRSEGPLAADTSNGAIRISGVKGNLRLDTSNGRIEADDVVGAVSADTSNGSIRISVAEPAPGEALRFETSNGSIEVTMKRYAANPMTLESSNGAITLRIPENINAAIDAKTSNSNIQTDFPVSVSGKIGKNALNATVGSGGPAITLSSSNGSLRLLRY